MFRKLPLVLPAILLIAACSRGAEPDPAQSSAAPPGQPAATAMPPSVATTAPPAASPAPAPPQAAAIPRAMQGRFGLVPADCTTTMGDDKGLVTIGATQMRFYESVAKLATVSASSADHLEGEFAYSGEGMEWRRKARLDSKDGGRTLVLEEFGEDAVPGLQIYKRCPA